MQLILRESNSREAIAGVQVSCRTPVSWSAVSDALGSVVLPSLAGDRITLTLTQAEFALQPENASVDLNLGVVTVLDLTRQLQTVIVKRIHPKYLERRYGHWWIEIDGTRSYGWWPRTRVSLWQTFFGVEGSLNRGGVRAGGSLDRDPHHGEIAERQFHPMVVSGASADAVKTCLRRFAEDCRGAWQWFFGLGQNCHTFQRALMRHCQLREPGK